MKQDHLHCINDERNSPSTGSVHVHAKYSFTSSISEPEYILFLNIRIFTTYCSCNQTKDTNMKFTRVIWYIMKCNIFQMLTIVNGWLGINMMELIKIYLLF